MHQGFDSLRNRHKAPQGTHHPSEKRTFRHCTKICEKTNVNIKTSRHCTKLCETTNTNNKTFRHCTRLCEKTNTDIRTFKYCTKLCEKTNRNIRIFNIISTFTSANGKDWFHQSIHSSSLGQVYDIMHWGDQRYTGAKVVDSLWLTEKR